MMNCQLNQQEESVDAGGVVRMGALDVGSNSFHLIVVEVDPRGRMTVLARAKEMVRLGASTLVDGSIPAVAFGRGIDALRSLRLIAESHGIEALVAVATSAVREAHNGPEFVRAAAEHAGVAIRVIDGIEEARLIFEGARGALDLAGRRVALFDLGGGSMEAIVADQAERHLEDSLKIGVLRMRDRWTASEQPNVAEREALSLDVRNILRSTAAAVRKTGYDFVALSSGTAQALAKLAHAESPRSPAQRLTLSALHAIEHKLAGMTVAERGALPGVEARRADTILVGAIILRTLLEELGASEATICDLALREGIVADYLAKRET